MIKILFQIVKLSPDRRKLYFLIKSILGFYPNNLDIFELSIIHKSALIRNDKGEIINNERLEFLGDAVLGAVVAQELYERYPHVNEGFLTKTRSKIVNRSFLNETAVKLGLDNLICSQSKLSLEKTNITGDALEALIGAIFVDRGYKYSQKFIRKKILFPYVNLNEITKKDTNFKSKLIEWGQKNKRDVQFITDEIQDTAEHTPVFISSVEIDNTVFGRGEGGSKKESQQNAAMDALHNVSIHKKSKDL